MMCDEKEYNPQGGSLLAYIITQGRLRCTCQPCAIESITPDGVMAHRVVWWRLVGAGVRDAFPPPMCVWIIYAFRLGGLRGKILRSVVGAVPMCPPASPCKGASTIHPRAQCVYSRYGNAAARTFGRAHRRRPYAFCLRELRMDVRPYGFVLVDCAWAFDVVWVDYPWMVGPVWG